MDASTPQELSVAAIRVLSAYQVERAKSGHPGMALGAADVAFVLWTKFLRYVPEDPEWIARDRFVLSAGHGSALLYSLLHLAGFPLSIDDLIQFRQLNSKTPGHPERGTTPGVELTTGPLGQGLGAAVGMALGLKMLESRFNGPGFPGLPARVFVLASDGDMMEGISSEAGSMAGHLRLDNLIVVYDSNHVTIDGSTDLCFSEDVAARFASFGWSVHRVDGHDHPSIEAALAQATSTRGSPSLIVATTVLAKGVPGHEGDHRLHGAPLGPQKFQALLEAQGWRGSPVDIPPDARAPFQARAQQVREEYRSWQRSFQAWRSANPSGAALWDAMMAQPVAPDTLERFLEAVGREARPTRLQSAAALAVAAPRMPWLVGGSADLTESNGLPVNHMPPVSARSYGGQRIHFGVREHLMAAMVNGLATLRAFRPLTATFLTFCDYMRPAMRLACLMRLPVIYVFSHDSIFVGEDGPTHQPVEHLASLRSMPRLTVLRPADGYEVAAAWAWILQHRDGPVALVLTRQSVDPLPRQGGEPPPVHLGAYVVHQSPDPRATVVATGSEVVTAVHAAGILRERGIPVNVVSMPSMELFMAQPEPYRASVIPPRLPKVGVEAGVRFGWDAIIGPEGLFIGVQDFGKSAPWGVLQEAFGFTPQAVADTIAQWITCHREEQP